jgi:hypothetical protein
MQAAMAVHNIVWNGVLLLLFLLYLETNLVGDGNRERARRIGVNLVCKITFNQGYCVRFCTVFLHLQRFIRRSGLYSKLTMIQGFKFRFLLTSK